MQRLILPINKCKVNAGYKSEAYRKDFGFAHFGVDLGSTDGSTQVYACGDGEVIAAGMDGQHDKDRLGNCIVIVYRDVRLPDGRLLDLACRMFHFAKIYCKAGDLVTKDTVIGLYGNTGGMSTGAHLHLEFDTDVEYPRHAYGIAASGNVIKKGSVDSTLNPSLAWYRDSNQSITTSQEWIKGGWCFQADVSIPALPAEEHDCQGTALQKEIDALREQLRKKDAQLQAFKDLANSI